MIASRLPLAASRSARIFFPARSAARKLFLAALRAGKISARRAAQPALRFSLPGNDREYWPTEPSALNEEVSRETRNSKLQQHGARHAAVRRHPIDRGLFHALLR